MSRIGSGLVSLVLLGVLLVPANAALIGPGTPIPDSEVLINFSGTGLDWVYAGPVLPGDFGPGEIEAPSFRASEGWRYATAPEWALRPDWDDFIKPGFGPGDISSNQTDHTEYRFASEYWSTFTHVDVGDAQGGFVSNGLDINLISLYETWYVRTSQIQGGEVPEPASLLAWLGFGCLCFGRRFRSVISNRFAV
jgi:hypothetical protein